MTIAPFKSFISTVNPFRAAGIFATRRVLADPITGAPVGIQNDSANGADGIWAPIDITAAQVTSPTPAMIADLNATFRLNVAPYTRYTSDGTQLVTVGGDDNVQGPGGLFGNMLVYSPLTVTDPNGLVIRGQIRVVSFPA